MKTTIILVALFTSLNVWACDKDHNSSHPVVGAPNTGKTHQVITSEGTYLVMPSYTGNTTYVIQTGKAKK